MKLSDFDFELDNSLIAKHPSSPRDHAKMLVIGNKLTDKHVYDLPYYLRVGDLIIFNNTKVIPARLLLKKGEANIEIMLHQRLFENHWLAFTKPVKKLSQGDKLELSRESKIEILEKREMGEVKIRIISDMNEFEVLEKHGQMPLPPYIKRDIESQDKEAYQTIFAKHQGSVAAPTAGLHFTNELLDEFRSVGVDIAYVTLHVGAGTFLPVKVEDISQHQMHHEYFSISAETATKINQTKANGGRIIAVGTTTLRVLESALNKDAKVIKTEGSTDLFITPGYKFKVIDLLMTNFHLPKSTLFMLVCAFAGMDKIKAAYGHAISKQYRFFSYGDACLLMRE